MSAAFWLIAYVPLAVLRGFVVTALWQWYVTDTFGVRALALVEAIGLSMLVGLFTARVPRSADEGIDHGYQASYFVIYHLFALGAGWAWTLVR